MVPQKITSLMQAIDALTLRERFFVLAAALIVTIGAWEAFLAGPLQAREEVAIRKINATSLRLAQMDQTMALAAEGIGGGMSNNFNRLTALRRQVLEGEESVRVFTSDLIDPAQMRHVLEDLIGQQRGLELISASNLEVRPVIEPDPAEGEASSDSESMLFRHGFVIEVEGSYLDCLAYLEAVERMPWQLYWGRLNLRTLEHPLTRVTIELHTLSLEEDWIGV